MHIAILGRQPELGLAELERLYGGQNVRWFSDTAATVNSDALSADRLGGTVKAGNVVLHLKKSTWRHASQTIVSTYSDKWSAHEGKITLGLSVYGMDISPRDVQKVGLSIKRNLRKSGVSLRLIPNAEAALSSATSHHNKLGLSPNKVELLVVHSQSEGIIVAESSGAQNITALARRDQGRPRRDAFVGMLPPKLALLMVNLAAGERKTPEELRLLDPFCGTGVVLQEAALRGYNVYGTDLNERMIDYTRENLKWLSRTHRADVSVTLHQADAMNATWEQPIHLVASETYLGQPFSAFPSQEKLGEVKRNVSQIFSSFLANIAPQLEPGASLCLAIPAWHEPEDDRHTGTTTFERLPADGQSARYNNLDAMIEALGFRRHDFSNLRSNDLFYYRPDQVVARQILVLEKK